MNIAWFSEISNKDVALVGGKGASLGEMYNIKLPIPPGFCITADAYKLFLEKANIKDKITKILKEIDINNNESLQNKSKQIRELILNSEIPNELKKEIIEAYDNLNVSKDILKASLSALKIIKAGRDLPYVAVRSSATAEDLEQVSFAGQQETFLNIKGNNNVLEAVKKCWASLFTARATYYREKNNFEHMKVYLCVIIQKMINSQKAGVVFTLNPSTNNKDEIVIEAGFGLGEAVVSGAINPDNYTVDKQTLNIKSKKINKQTWALYRDEYLGKTVRRNLSKEKQEEQVLDENEINNLSKLAKQIEDHYEKPMDIEFAIENGKIYIVQARPVTTIKKIDKIEKHEEIKGNILLEGLAASPGVASGKVRLISSIEELDKIQKGDILVTRMTNPDYVPAMERASGIVTDEGGATCFGENTKVLTNKGFISIKEAYYNIKNKEELFIFSYDYKNKKPSWKKLIDAGKRKRQGIRISVSQKGILKHNVIDITPDHKMFTFDNRNLIKKEIKDILKDNEYLCLLEKLPELDISKDKEKEAYLLGALLSDGHIRIDYHKTGNPRRGSITFTQKDIESKRDFINTVKSYFYDVFNEDFSSERVKETIGNIRGRQIRGFATDFTCYRLESALKLTKLIQNLDLWSLTLNENSALNFLAGLIDGDGCLYRNRLHIYINKENILQATILNCLKLGIIPQITTNRNIHHIQIVEKIDKILQYTKRVKGETNTRIIGTKFFSAKQILGDIIDKVNWKGKIKPYVKNNLIIDSDKIKKRILLMLNSDIKLKSEILSVLNSNLRMNRINKIEDLGDIMVYNLEVKADEELEHNYVVFTEKYTPLLVSNSHAAIVSRELGIPAVVGTDKATLVLDDDQLITVDGSSGKVYEGEIKIQYEEEKYEYIETITKIKTITDLPESVDRALKVQPDGIGLVRIEFMIVNGKIHPSKYIKDGREEDYINLLVSNLEKIASPFKNKTIWVRTSDIRTDEYRDLEGGEDEPTEANPMIGLHGIRRALAQPDILKAEFKAIKILHDKGYKNVGIMLPFLISLEELQKSKSILREIGLEPVKDIDFGVMIETPASVWIIEDLCKDGISFISFGTNDLTQTTLGVDRNNEHIQNLYNEMHPAILREIRYAIDICKKYKVETSICGQAGSNPEMAEFLVKCGIDSISVNVDAITKIRKTVAQAEKKLLLDHIRSNR